MDYVIPVSPLLSKASDEYWVLMFKRLLVTFYISSKSNCQFKDFKKKKKPEQIKKQRQ